MFCLTTYPPGRDKKAKQLDWRDYATGSWLLKNEEKEQIEQMRVAVRS